MGLKERVMDLEKQIWPTGIDHDRIYTALMQIEESTGVLAMGETEEAWMNRFVERNGTREQFIENSKIKEAQRNGL